MPLAGTEIGLEYGILCASSTHSTHNSLSLLITWDIMILSEK